MIDIVVEKDVASLIFPWSEVVRIEIEAPFYINIRLSIRQLFVCAIMMSQAGNIDIVRDGA